MKQRITVWSSLLLLGVCASAWPATGSAENVPDDVTVQGESVDMACYMAKESRGAAHKACAVMCAKHGGPIGVLTDNGALYLLLDDHNNEDPYEAVKKLAGERAEVTGKKIDKQGVAGIVVGSAKGL